MASRQSLKRMFRLAITYFEHEDSVAKVDTKKIQEKDYIIGSTVTVDGVGWNVSGEKGEIKFLHGKSQNVLRNFLNKLCSPLVKTHSFC